MKWRWAAAVAVLSAESALGLTAHVLHADRGAPDQVKTDNANLVHIDLTKYEAVSNASSAADASKVQQDAAAKHQAAANATAATNATTLTAELVKNGTTAAGNNTAKPPCNWTRDIDGVIRPAVCHSTTSKEVVCTAAAHPAFFNDGKCMAPVLNPCVPPLFGDIEHTLFVKGSSSYPVHGDTLDISCGQGYVPIDKKQPYETWGENSYIGRKHWVSVCNNGTWTHLLNTDVVNVLKPVDLKCVTPRQLQLLRHIQYYASWTESKLAEANGVNFTWIDEAALRRKTALMQAQNLSWEVLRIAKEDAEIPPEVQLEAIVNALKDNAVVMRGEPFTAETCSNLQAHFTSTRFECSYTAQKKPLKFNDAAWRMQYSYKNGCYCESSWTGLCPFRLDHKTNYKDFGFSGFEEKEISRKVGPGTKALCWYWSDDAHPEWGFQKVGV